MPWPYTYQQPSNQFQNSNLYNMQLPQMQVVRVNGRGGAEAFSMGANSSVLLLDEHEPIVYLKVTDGASYSTIKTYSITPISDKPNEFAINYSKLEERVSALEDMISKNHTSTNDVSSA